MTPDQALALIEGYRQKPVEYVRDVYGLKPWELQEQIINAIFTHKTVAVKTSNAVGKSYIAAAIAHEFLDLYPGGLVVTTAPTWRQVKDVLWRYFGTIHKTARYSLGGRLTQTGLEYDTDWYAVGLSTKYPENFFGYHADHILVIVDEAGGVEEAIFKGVKAITPNINAHVLYIGNPTNPAGTFYEAFNNPKLAIKRFTISAFDSPNFTSTGILTLDDLLKAFTPQNEIEQTEWTNAVNKILQKKMDPTYQALIDPSTVYERYIEWGTDSPAWASLVMGEFPGQAEQSLIPADLVRMAMEMNQKDEETGKTYAELSGWNIPDGPPEYGQDMARFGSDLNVLTPRRGGWVDQQIIWNKKGDEKKDLMASARQILNVIDPLDFNTRVNIDDTGNGGGTTDRLREYSTESLAAGAPSHQYQLAAYNFSSKERMGNPAKFHDITSELYWNLRSWFYKKQIAMHYDEKLFNELVSRRWGITPSGKIKVESKEEYKKRTGGRSPDRSDSLALAFAGGIRQQRIPEELRTKEPDDESKRFTSGIRRGAW